MVVADVNADGMYREERKVQEGGCGTADCRVEHVGARRRVDGHGKFFAMGVVGCENEGMEDGAWICGGSSSDAIGGLGLLNGMLFMSVQTEESSVWVSTRSMRAGESVRDRLKGSVNAPGGSGV